MGFEYRHEAEQCLAAWHTRLQQFGLALHPEKTRLLEFGRFAATQRKQRGEGKPETFDFLGFTHFCGKTRTNGRFIVQRKTIKKRLRAKLQEVKAELRLRWHDPVPDVGQWLRRVVQGYFNFTVGGPPSPRLGRGIHVSPCSLPDHSTAAAPAWPCRAPAGRTVSPCMVCRGGTQAFQSTPPPQPPAASSPVHPLQPLTLAPPHPALPESSPPGSPA